MSVLFEYNGMKINYITVGSGRDVVILHGWGASIGAVSPIVNLLKDRFRVTAIDLPGCGESSDPIKPLEIADYADLVLAVCKKEGVEGGTLIAHSNGGRIAIYINTKTDFKVDKNIFIDTAGVPAKKSFKLKAKTRAFKCGKALLKLFGAEKTLEKLQNKMGSEDYRNAVPVMRKTLVKMISSDLRGDLPSIKAPTLLIWGENDAATPLSTAQEAEKLIPDCGLVVLKGAGHFSYLDRPAQFAAVVNSFMGEKNG